MGLPRMCDKAQLDSEGQLPGELRYPCPNDQRLLGKMNMDSSTFQSIVTKSGSDDDVVAQLQEKIDSVDKGSYEALRNSRFRVAKHSSSAALQQQVEKTC